MFDLSEIVRWTNAICIVCKLLKRWTQAMKPQGEYQKELVQVGTAQCGVEPQRMTQLNTCNPTCIVLDFCDIEW